MAKKHPAEFKAKVLAEVKEGKLSIPKIADKHGLNNSIIYAWLGRTKGKKAAFASPRKKGGYAPRIPQNIRNNVMAEIDKGMSLRAAAEKHGVRPSTVYNWSRDGRLVKSNGMGQVTETYKVSKVDDYKRDAVSFLRHARVLVNEDLRAGKIKQYDRVHLLMMLALSEMEQHGH